MIQGTCARRPSGACVRRARLGLCTVCGREKSCRFEEKFRFAYEGGLHSAECLSLGTVCGLFAAASAANGPNGPSRSSYARYDFTADYLRRRPLSAPTHDSTGSARRAVRRRDPPWHCQRPISSRKAAAKAVNGPNGPSGPPGGLACCTEAERDLDAWAFKLAGAVKTRPVTIVFFFSTIFTLSFTPGPPQPSTLNPKP